MSELSEIDVLLRDMKKYGNAGRDCALSAEDALTIAAALEAAREDACVALVADIRFACGDNGKRMQPELVEHIRELAEDAERYRWLRTMAKERFLDLKASGAEYSLDMRTHWCIPTLICSGPVGGFMSFDAAIDQARGKGVAGG